MGRGEIFYHYERQGVMDRGTKSPVPSFTKGRKLKRRRKLRRKRNLGVFCVLLKVVTYVYVESYEKIYGWLDAGADLHVPFKTA